MIYEEQLVELQNEWRDASVESDLGLWWIANDVRDLLPNSTEESVMGHTIEAIRPLLVSGSLRAGQLLPDGAFDPWDGTVEQQLDRIVVQWRELGHKPGLGDIVWFISGVAYDARTRRQ